MYFGIITCNQNIVKKLNYATWILTASYSTLKTGDI